MKKITSSLILTAACLAIAPMTATAASVESSQNVKVQEAVKSDAKAKLMVVQNETMTPAQSRQQSNVQSSETLYAPLPRQTVQSATTQQDGLIAVRDNEGQVFYNHVLSTQDLTPVDYDIDVVDTYTFTHNGRTYVNKVVQ